MATLRTPQLTRRSSGTSTASNPQSKSLAALDAIGQRPRRQQPRPTKQAPYELANHSKAYLEARSYACGYDFLHSLLTAGTSISVPAKPYVGYLAPAAQLALASSLIAYPAITTKAKSADAIDGSDAALRYLRSVLKTIDGPAYTTIRRAFSFPDERTRHRAPAKRRANRSLSPGAVGDIGDIERIAGTASNELSLWYRAEDFWHAVGWAFNCSVVHKERWRRWKLWLEVMVDFLEADWEVCMQSSKEEGVEREKVLKDSLLWRYVCSKEPGQRTTRRRIVRAMFATASLESRKEFTEVWDQEVAKLVSSNTDKKLIDRIDFETGELGDYDSDEEDVLMNSTTEKTNRRLRSRRSSTTSIQSNIECISSDSVDVAEWLGGIDAIHLRQRLIALLTQLALALPAQFTTGTDFFDTMTEEVIHMPVTVLPLFFSTSKLSGAFQLAFNANLLLPMVTGKLPDYATTLPEQAHFESPFLPLRATTQSYATNAKVSLILEQMFMYMMTENHLTPTTALREAVELGIASRQSVYGTAKGKNWSEEGEILAKQIIETSSERLLGMLEILEVTAGMAPQPLKEKSQRAPPPQVFPSFDTISSLSSPQGSDVEMGD